MPSTGIDRIDGNTTSVAVKPPVRICVNNPAAPTVLSGIQTLQAVTLQAGGASNTGTATPDRVLVNDQTNQTLNGIYLVQTGAWILAYDSDGPRDLVNGTLIPVEAGTYAGTMWQCTCTDNPIDIGISNLTFAQNPLILPSATSTSSNTIGTGSKTFTVPQGMPWVAGQWLQIIDSANPANYMIGTITSYSGTTLVFSSTATAGSGTYSTWNIVGSSSPGAAGATGATGVPGTSALPVPPQGRLSLQSGIAVQTQESVAQTSIYYVPYIGNLVPVYSGSVFVLQALASQLTLALSATNHPTSEVFDVYLSMQGGTPTLSAMYWGSNTSRSTTAGGKSGTGNASITQLNGIWVNNAAISASDSFNGSVGVAIAQNQGTLLGTFYTTANGQTGVSIKPTKASGGTNNIIGLFNAYNRVRARAMCSDSTSSWTYGTAAWRVANGSNSNRISWVDGLQQINVDGAYNVSISMGSSSNNCAIGVALNSVTPILSSNAVEYPTSLTVNTMQAENFYPQLGFNYIQAVEFCTTGTQTFGGNGNMSLQWNGEI